MLARNYVKRQRKGRAEPSKIHRAHVKKHVCVGGKNNMGAFCNPERGIDCAHYRSAENSGMAQKPSCIWLVPFCRNCHSRQHQIGQLAFEKERGIDMKKEALDLALSSRDPIIKLAAQEYIASKKVKQ